MNTFYLVTSYPWDTVKCSWDPLLVVCKPAVRLAQSGFNRLIWHLGYCPFHGIEHFRFSFSLFSWMSRAKPFMQKWVWSASKKTCGPITGRLVLTQRDKGMGITYWLPGKRSDRDTPGDICTGWGTGLLMAGLLVIWLSNKFTAPEGTVLLLISKL